MLSDVYYLGYVVYKGQVYPARHEPLIDQELFDRVQDVRNLRSRPGQRDRVLQHYLKGALFCRRCRELERTSRLIYTEARSRTGRSYGYFLCRSRQNGACDPPHLPAALVEQAMVDQYATLRLPGDFIAEVNALLDDALADEQSSGRTMHTALKRRLEELDGQEERLLDLAADGSIPQEKIKTRLRRIQVERDRAKEGLLGTGAELGAGANVLREALSFIADPHAMYRDACDETRRLMNQTFYERFYVDEEIVIRGRLSSPFDDFHEAAKLRVRRGTGGCRTSTPIKWKGPQPPEQDSGNEKCPSLTGIYAVPGSSKGHLVELRGLEPLTSLRSS
ncbi:hypothetical protein AB0L63_03715 [Nocardia sp. NPDC051990]|uniref:hypothetical protein n=1 Tax=Nocardia sp. NPDC051990 TaxID=3155285 RepID=UPI00341F5E4D